MSSTTFRRLTPLVALSCGLTAFCFFVSISRLAFAQTTTAPNELVKSQLVGLLIQALAGLAVAVLTAILALVPKGFAWLSAHLKIAKNAWADSVKDRFLGIVEHFVLLEMQTTVDTLKADAANGALTPDQLKTELQKVKQRVVDNAIAAASRQSLVADLHTVLGTSSDGQLAKFAGDAIEVAVARVKAPSLPASTPIATGSLSSMSATPPPAAS